MNNQFKLLLLGWVALGLVVIALAIYRKMLAKSEDISLHVLEAGGSTLEQQATNAHKLELVDKWGKALTAVELLYGIGLAAMYLYAVWMVSQKTFWTE
jgi:hypothetical protein